jgi:2-oxoglutarate ferredoxin oxidoreductase subunit alpha
MMTEKRMRKGATLSREVENFNPVIIEGMKDADQGLLCWGSTFGVCREVATALGLRLVQPIVLSPFPLEGVKVATDGVKRLIAVEENAEGQLAMLFARNGIRIDHHIRRYDGRPFSVEDLEARVREALV